MGAGFLNTRLYPRQGTLLKLIFLRDDLLTEYDYEVIGQWSQGFTLPPRESWPVDRDVRYDGYWGIQPDILERIEICRERGRKWFSTMIYVGGRRCGKGYIGAIAMAYVAYHYLALGDPQAFYEIDTNKRLAMFVFAGKLQQAKANQWRDIVNVVLSSECFEPYINRALGEQLTINTPRDLIKKQQLLRRGVKTAIDMASIEITPKESTPIAARGPASFAQAFDEMAHVLNAGSNRSAEEVYESAQPSLDQFGVDSFTYAGSSPWQMVGKFYELWEQSLAVDPQRGFRPVYFDYAMVQLQSWDIYEDWERAHRIPLLPRGHPALTDRRHFYIEQKPHPDTGEAVNVLRPFQKITRPVQVYDERMELLERANPTMFAIERRARWATSLDSYLSPLHIRRAFAPWPDPEGEPLQHVRSGTLANSYVAHGDPSKSGKNFGFAIAHTVGPDEDGLYHVVFDYITHWEPSSFPDNNYEIDYLAVADEITELAKGFMPTQLTFDQFNSAMLIQRIRKDLREAQLPKATQIWEQTATAKLNWAMAECFKTALYLGLIHAPWYDQAEKELMFLQDKGGKVEAPTVGAVQTKDVYDAMANVTWGLIGVQMAPFMKKELAELALSASQPGGMPMQADRQPGSVIDQLSGLTQGTSGQLPYNPSRGWVPDPRVPPRR
jgi:hypothetical protein